ncbi:PLP-dependent aminotransferase family protein [Peribacillus alkalitolerans]|uniref:MocR-like pyridoxine biosynthesis transcription factor PdxR n=1 Tax=Peribacillus alkalitolerans TaxID=1550385 RepID=UPI001967550B|nr:PLP-dependent aminotransferase family protein [Peribacillus alkalitolerans]
MIELTPLLDREIEVPLYVQLYQYIRKEIETGGIEPGAVLPSIRYLSKHLNISKNTIENAYQQLIAEGYVESQPRSGLKVLPLEQPLISLHTNVKDVKPSVKLKKEPYLYNFLYGDIDSEHFPMKKWKRCLQEAMAVETDLFMYGDRQGDYKLRSEIANYLFQARGVSCDPGQILLCSSTQYAISLICQWLSLNRTPIAMEEPGYDGVRTVFENYGCDIQTVPLESDGIDVSKLNETNAKVAYITPSHQFPYGMVLPIQKRLNLLEWAHLNGSYIIEDDYDSEFRYQGQPIPALKALDTNDRVIYLGTFSKSFLPTLRLSYLVMPISLMEIFHQQIDRYSQSSSPLFQKAMFLFMKEGHFERHVRKMRHVYQGKHKALIQAIGTYMGDRVEVIGQRAGLHILLKVKEKHYEDLMRKAELLGVKVYNTEKYWFKGSSESSSIIMLGFGGLTEQQIIEGIKRLNQAWFEIP